jgi:hypothetical protein
MPGGGAYAGSVLLPSGKVLLVPFSGTKAAILDFHSNALGQIPLNMVLSPFFNRSK